MNEPEQIRIKVLPARQGFAWLMQALVLMRAQAARLLLIAVLLQLILGLTRIPLVGFLIILAVPGFSAGVLQAFRQVAAGQRFAASVLFAPLVSGARGGRFIALGAILFAVAILSVSLVLAGSDSLLDPELLARIEQGDVEAVMSLDPNLILRFIMALAMGVGISGTLSYLAIPLVWFRDAKLGTALLSGLQAMLMNWRPFTMLAIGLALLLIPVAMLMAVLFSMVGGAGALSFIVAALVMLIALAFQMIVFGTQYCSFLEIYGLGDDSPSSGDGQGTDDEGQLLA